MWQKIPEIFIQPFPHWKKIDFFRKVLYAFLLFNAISLLPVTAELFSYDGIVGSGGWNTAIPWYKQGSRFLLNVLSHPANENYYWLVYVFVYGQILALIAGLFNFLPKLSAVLVYFFTVNLFLKGYLMFTGGEVLVNLLLFYLIFIQRSDRKKERKVRPYFSVIQNVLNNTFYWMLLIQVCVLYFFSALYKFFDPYWVDGTALMYVARIDGFSSDIVRALFADNETLAMIGTYSVLFYQAVFFIAVWIKKVKIPFLLFGMFLHLSIAFGMGIFTFGFVMVISYILFLNDKQIEWLKTFWKKRKAT